ncbi:hypothetical protein [Nonomuraea sp. SYSU D8015]|uniref:hypothetical protein n=1 Tax=Nonomuraea sp. SYSU D8015 TaxID=2593644 RepID=UPI001660BEB9|nr:hypothetical protein [Nonomuraea sp. SYSU D8015]
MPAAFAAVHDDYTAALERAPLDDDACRAYASRIRAFLAWLDAADLDNADPLSDAHGRDFTVAYKILYSRPGGGQFSRAVRDPLRHLTAYGSTNRYRPVNSCKTSGNSGR